MTASTSISQQAADTEERDRRRTAAHPAPLAPRAGRHERPGPVPTRSGATRRAAFALGHDWTATFGADVCAMEVSEQHDRRHAAGARTARPATTAAAGAARANVARRVVSRCTGGRSVRAPAGWPSAITRGGGDAAAPTSSCSGWTAGAWRGVTSSPSLRDQLTSATALPVLVAPSTAPAGRRRRSASGADVPRRGRRTAPAEHVEGYAHV